MEQKVPADSTQIKRTKLGVAIGAATTVAVGVALGRFIFLRTSQFGKYKRRMEEWLTPRVEALSLALAVASEMAAVIESEVSAAMRDAAWIGYGARKASPEKSDLLEIALEKRLLKMKMKLHKLLSITDAKQTLALHTFYEELRAWLMPISERGSDLSSAQRAESVSHPLPV